MKLSTPSLIAFDVIISSFFPTFSSLTGLVTLGPVGAAAAAVVVVAAVSAAGAVDSAVTFGVVVESAAAGVAVGVSWVGC